MSFVERSIILCPYLGGSTIGGSTVIYYSFFTKALQSTYNYSYHVYSNHWTILWYSVVLLDYIMDDKVNSQVDLERKN